MHGFQLYIIIDDIVTDWHSEAGVSNLQQDDAERLLLAFTRQKNVLFESCKKYYTAYNGNKMRKACI